MSNDNNDYFEEDDDFDFLEEEGFEDNDNVTQRAAPQAKSPIEKLPANNKIVFAAVGATALLIAGYFVMGKKSSSETQMAQAVPQAISQPKTQEHIADKKLAIKLPEQQQTQEDKTDKPKVNNQLTLGNLAEGLNKAKVEQEAIASENKTASKDVVAENKSESFEDFAKAFAIDNNQAGMTESEIKLPNKNQVTKSSAKVSPQMEQTLKDLSDEMMQNINQIQMLQSAIEDLATKVNTVNTSVGSMDNKVLSLTETVNSLTQDVVQVKKSMADDIDENAIITHKAKDQPLIYNAPEYAVHAIIPGRAWLKSSNGQIITVTEGDSLGDYGNVAVIDANNSIVRTSSGISFR